MHTYRCRCGNTWDIPKWAIPHAAYIERGDDIDVVCETCASYFRQRIEDVIMGAGLYPTTTCAVCDHPIHPATRTIIKLSPWRSYAFCYEHVGDVLETFAF